jgi:acyl-CoA synthetase (AMP-forming)/AMP-acid ligase II
MPQRALGKMLVGNVIATAAARAPDKLAFYCASTGRRFTFRDTNERCNRLANSLASLGVAKGDVLAFLCSNRAEMPEIYFALAKSGIIGIPLNYRLAPTEAVKLLRAMGARALVFEARFEACALHIKEHMPEVRHYVTIGASGARVGIEYEAFLAQAAGDEPQVEIDEADPYYFNLTSGTTGLPKSYLLTQFNNSAIGMFGPSLDMTRQDVVLTVFPVFGRVGVAWILTSVMYGIPNVLTNFEPAEVLRLIQEERVSIFNMVPTMAAMLLASDRLRETDLSSLRAVVFAGAVLPAPIREQALSSFSTNIYEYYGMQETGVLVYSTPQDREVHPESIGRASLFSEVKVVDPLGREMPVGEIGEIIGRSPNTVTSYFQNPEKSADTFRNGWLHTGDLGSFDADGFLYIRGRKKDMIITGGQNVHAAEVEETLLRHEAIADCAVIGLPDALWGEVVVAVIVTKQGRSVDFDALKAFCREQIAGFKTPKKWFIHSDALPRTATGKVQKFLLVEKYAERADSA